MRLRDNKERLCEKLCLDRSLFRGAVKRNLYVPLSMPRAWHSLSYRRETLPQFNKERCTESFHGHFFFSSFLLSKNEFGNFLKKKKLHLFRQPSGFPFSSGAVWRRRRRRRNLFSSSVRCGLRWKEDIPGRSSEQGAIALNDEHFLIKKVLKIKLTSRRVSVGPIMSL